MFKALRPNANGRDKQPAPSQEGRVFQVPFGSGDSRIIIRPTQERVERMLLLYEPRSDGGKFIRIRLPCGLPADDDITLAKQAQEDADAWLDMRPLKWALEQDETLDVKETATQVSPRFGGAAPAPRPAAPQPAPPKAQKPRSAPPPRERSPKRATEAPEPIETWRGEILAIGVEQFRRRGGHVFDSFAVTIVGNDGVTQKVLGVDLDGKVRDAGVGVGDYVEIRHVGRHGRMKLFEVFSLE